MALAARLLAVLLICRAGYGHAPGEPTVGIDAAPLTSSTSYPITSTTEFILSKESKVTSPDQAGADEISNDDTLVDITTTTSTDATTSTTTTSETTENPATTSTDASTSTTTTSETTENPATTSTDASTSTTTTSETTENPATTSTDASTSTTTTSETTETPATTSTDASTPTTTTSETSIENSTSSITDYTTITSVDTTEATTTFKDNTSTDEVSKITTEISLESTSVTLTSTEPVQTTTTDPCANKPCLNGGDCITTEDGFSCKCRDPWTGDICEKEDRCKTGDALGQRICEHAGATCISLDGLNTFLCKCGDPHKVFNLTAGKCEELESCFLKGCTEAEECSRSGQCICRKGMERVDGTCEEIKCKENENYVEAVSACICKPGFKNSTEGCISAECEVPEWNTCDYRRCTILPQNNTQFCGECLEPTVENRFKCVVPEEMACENDTKLDCGPNGRCFQQEGNEFCVCDSGFDFNGTTCEVIPPPREMCPQWNGSHCHCPEPSYVPFGPICNRTFEECKDPNICGDGAICQLTLQGHQCLCPTGQRYDSKARKCTGQCARNHLEKCREKKALCKLDSHGQARCTCPPGRVVGLYGCMFAQSTLVGSLRMYGILSDFENDLTVSMQNVFKSFAEANILNCTNERNGSSECLVELKFMDKVTELRGEDIPCLPTETDSVCLLPPNLLLDSTQLESAILLHRRPCQTHAELCPPNTDCYEVEHEIGYSCRCKENMTVINNVPSSGSHVIEICEDTRCETHDCPAQSSCHIGEFGPVCLCEPGAIRNQTSGQCIEPCNPNPCLHDGICQVTILGVTCKCRNHYVGNFCEKDELRSARSTLVLVAAVLGAAIFVLLIVSVIVINRYRREAKCSRTFNHSRPSSQKARMTITPRENFGFEQE